MSGTDDLIAQEQWLRGNGLPLVVPASRRFRGVVPRTVPLLVAFAFIATGLLLLDAVVSTDEPIALLDLLGRPATIVGFLVAGVVTLGGIPLAVAYAGLQRRLQPRTRLVFGLLIIAFWIVGLSLIAMATGVHTGIHLSIGIRLALLLVAALIGFYGLGNMLRWAARRGARELAAAVPAIARILPLLLLTVLLVFFTNELWQLAATISRTRMWLLSGFLILMTVLIVLPPTIDMIDEEGEHDEAPLLEETPFAGIEARRSRLSLGERFNLLAVSLLVQFVQISVFVAATFAVFALFGQISLTDELISTWTGAEARPLVIWGIALPLEAHIFRVCAVLALFSGVSFAASTLQDKMYRTLFLDRVAEDVRRNLAARHRYRATLVRNGRAPQRWLAVADD